MPGGKVSRPSSWRMRPISALSLPSENIRLPGQAARRFHAGSGRFGQSNATTGRPGKYRAANRRTPASATTRAPAATSAVSPGEQPGFRCDGNGQRHEPDCDGNRPKAQQGRREGDHLFEPTPKKRAGNQRRPRHQFTMAPTTPVLAQVKHSRTGPDFRPSRRAARGSARTDVGRAQPRVKTGIAANRVARSQEPSRLALNSESEASTHSSSLATPSGRALDIQPWVFRQRHRLPSRLREQVEDAFLAAGSRGATRCR